MNLNQDLLRGIYGYGFEKPSAIQARAIIPCVKGHDVIAQAQSGKFVDQTFHLLIFPMIVTLMDSYMVYLGTGKTATFSISILQQIDPALNECQALILAPTRELAQQVRFVSFVVNSDILQFRSLFLKHYDFNLIDLRTY